MDSRFSAIILILSSCMAWTQAVPSAEGTLPDQIANPMRTPPSVSGEEDFLSLTGAEMRRNYMLGALTITPAYNDNVSPYVGGKAVSDQSYSVYSTLTMDRATPRMHQSFTYAPGLTLYGRTSELNNVDQGFSASFQYKPSEYSALELRDHFVKSSNAFGTPSMSLTPTAGGTSPFLQGAIAPFADQLHNTFSGAFSYQYARNGMVGAAGLMTHDAYLGDAHATGLCDSDSRSGSAFYNLRLTDTTYTGMTYRYAGYWTCPGNRESDTQTHAIQMFFTFYPVHGLDIAISAGPQQYRWTDASLVDADGWTGSWTASAAWQAGRAGLSASYSRSVTGGGGLAGAFRTNDAAGTALWQISQRWSAAGGAQYDLQRNVSESAYASNPGGHTISGTISLGRSIGQHTRVDARYQRLHQRYSALSSGSVLPDANRASISISYYFQQPLGR